MSTSAKVILRQQDRSAIVPALSGIDIGTVVNAKWGDINPTLNTDPTDLVNKYYTPDNKKGSSWNGAELLLASSNKVWITRAIHDDAKYSAALVRFKTDTTNFNSYPLPGAVPDPVVKPISGIGLDALDAYSFPLYETERVYESTGIQVFLEGTSQLDLTSFTSTSGRTLSEGDTISFGPSADNSSNIYSITSAAVIPVLENVIITDYPVAVSAGVEVKSMASGAPVSFDPPVYTIQAAGDSTSVLVTSHDLIVNNSDITFDNGTTTVVAIDKTVSNRTAYRITLDSPPVDDEAIEGATIQLMLSSDTEYRDAFLAIARCPGDLGDKIKVGTRPSPNYDNAFFLDVYFDGVKEETFEVTRENQLDGFGNQMQIETKVNGVSKYVIIKENSADVVKLPPLSSEEGVWRRNSWDIFSSTTNSLAEDVFKGDVEITLTSTANLIVGSRIKLKSTGAEYKVQASNSTTKTITLDRAVVEGTVAIGSPVYLFDSTVNNPAAGVFNGSQYYKFTKIAAQSAYSIGDQLTISGNTGLVLDAGTNNVAGGFDGSPITVYDVIVAFQKMANKEKYKISLFCDNGFAYPEVAVAIDNICKNIGIPHGYLSSPYSAEKQVEAVAAVKDYRNSTNLNSEFSSMFTGWVQVTDVYNQTKVWVAPSVFGVTTQSFVTRNYYMFTPAAGWVYGRLNGLDISARYTEGQRDALVEANINPIRHREGYGLSVWGNETLYVKPSPLQLRSVAMLLIVLKYGLEEYLEFKLFAMNNEPTWVEIENALDIFIRDNLYTPGGLYGYQVKVKDIITDSDIDNRRCPVFVGLQPTMDIATIPVTIGIFNKSVSISV